MTTTPTNPVLPSQPKFAGASLFGLLITATALGLPIAGALYDAFQRAMQ